MNKKRSCILAIIFLLLLMPLVASQDEINVQTLGTIKVGDSILLKQNCVNTTFVTITSISVNGKTTIELISSPISMTLVSDGYQTYLWTNSTLPGQYIVTGICDENGVTKSWSYNYIATPNGTIFTLSEILPYLFFLIFCIVLCYLSIGLFIKYKFSNATISDHEMYSLKKRNNFVYYMTIFKNNFWIVGVFGVYLSLFIFTSLLEQLVYNLGLSDLDNLLQYVNLLLAWGFIPFVVFWIGWLIVAAYVTTERILKFQFGAMGGRR